MLIYDHGPRKNKLVLYTGHEWDYVVLSGVAAYPKLYIQRRSTPGWQRRHLGPMVDDHLVAVAITRARQVLVITHTSERATMAGQIKVEPSRFLAELPEEFIKPMSLPDH